MGTLLVCVLVLLGCCLTHGRNVSRCELRDELRVAVGTQLGPRRLNDTLAKIVCAAEAASNLNTSAVTVRPGTGRSGPEPGGRRARSPPHAPPQNVTCVGVFQLSAALACNGSVTPTKNTCGIQCSEMLDDDITDDVRCLVQVLREDHDWDHLDGIGHGHREACEHEKASRFFSGC